MGKRTKITAAALGVSLVMASSALAAHYPASITPNPKLTAAMVKLTGRTDSTVRCFVVNDGAEGGTWTDTAEVQLEPSVCKALRKWTWLHSPRAVSVFAHEGGHIVRGMSEGDANCYAGQNLYRAARLVGFGPHQAKLVVAQQRSENLTYCPAP